jgi:predicted naringenin-chalcone synthase
VSAHLLGIGTATPACSISQEDSLAAARRLSCLNGQERLLPVLYRRTNISRRGSILLREGGEQNLFQPAIGEGDSGPSTSSRLKRYRETAPVLAIEAARHAITDAEATPDQITHIVTASCTGFDAPGVDYHLIRALGLRPTTQRTHIGFMGCHAAINALRVARAYAEADPRARVLLCCVELCTLHYSYSRDPDKLVANAIFADGAAAGVVGGMPLASQRHGSSVPVQSHRHATLTILDTASCILPDSADAMTWAVGDHGFEMTLAASVPDLLKAHLRPWLESWLSTRGLTIEKIGGWAIHPGGPRVLSTVAECLSLTQTQIQASKEVLADHGNMSSPTVLFILNRLRSGRRPLVAIAFGPGLVAEAALLG